MRSSFIIASLFLLLALPAITHAEIPCAKITPAGDVPSGFGAPYSVQAQFFSLLKGQCSGSSFTVEAGNWEDNVYIYKYGYTWNDSLQQWERFPFRGARPSGEWLQGHASAVIERSLADLRKDNYAVAYICERTAGVWKCGCRDKVCASPSWQVQRFSIEHIPEAIFSVPVLPPISEVLVTHLSSMQAPPGKNITIGGAGFTDKNTIHINEHQLTNIPSRPDGNITFTVPDIPYGRYEVRVENEHGISTNPMIFVVTKPGASAPTVTDVSPQTARYGDTVTIQGSNFSPEHNSVFTGFEWIDNLPSPDGTSITFNVNFFSHVGGSSSHGALQGKTFPVVLTVANENGIAQEGPRLTIAL